MHGPGADFHVRYVAHALKVAVNECINLLHEKI